MFVKHHQQFDATAMETEGAEGVTFRLLIGHRDGAPHFAMRHFTVEPGGHTPLHRHPYEHEILVLSGKALVRSGDTYRGLQVGDALLVSPQELHQIRNCGDQALQFICLVPIQFDCGDGTCRPTPGS